MITINKRNGSIEEMPIEEFTRWMCLVEAQHFINEKAKDLNVNVDKLIKPLAIDDYIKERYSAMLHDVTIEHQLGNL